MVLSLPALFLLLLGPLADIALGVGRVRSRVAALLSYEQEEGLQLVRTRSGGIEAERIDSWIFMVARMHQSAQAKYHSCITVVCSPCRQFADAGVCVVGTTFAFIVLLVVAWPLGLSLAPIVVVLYIGSVCKAIGNETSGWAELCVTLLSVVWLIIYFVAFYPKFCPEKFETLQCSVSTVVIGVLRVIGFVVCLFDKNNSGNCFNLL